MFVVWAAAGRTALGWTLIAVTITPVADAVIVGPVTLLGAGRHIVSRLTGRCNVDLCRVADPAGVAVAPHPTW